MTTTPKKIIEALIFVSPEPLSLEKIKEVLSEYSERDIEGAIGELLQDYAHQDRGLQIAQAAGGYLLKTRPESDKKIKILLNMAKKNRLSHAALETLSAIAYHQPTTLSEISSLRGVDSSQALKTLLMKKLVKITGRKKAPGKPLIYRTSNKFLSYFGLNSLKDLPSKDEIEKIVEEEKKDVELS